MNLQPFLLGSTLVALAAQPGLASVTSITNVRLNPTATGLDLVFDTQGGDNSSIFTVSQGNTLQADITRAQLNLPDGGSFTQANPAPGISQVSVVPLDANSVRITVSGTSQPPTGAVESSDNQVVLSIRNDGETAQAPTPVPAEIETVPAPATPPTVAQAAPEPAPEPAPEAAPEVPTPASPDVLVPSPEVTIDGTPVPRPQVQQTPPFLPRAVAPPIGDIAVAEGVPSFNNINLGSNERIPKLLLRDAPAREVLSLLARAAGLNLVFTPAGGGTEGGAEGGSADGPPVSLDIENESVQDVFNHVLRVTGLQANRVGRSVYVGPTLPVSAQNVSARTLRLNQVDAAVATNFLVALGAESAVSRERLVTNVNAVTVAEGTPPITETQTSTVEQIEVSRVDYEDSQGILRGLQVVADERTNSVTLVGRADLIAIATEQLTRIDLRRRQVAVNVRVIDIDLNSLDAFGTSFSFQNGLFGVLSSGGLGILNIGDGGTPNPISQGTPTGTPITPRPLGGPGANNTSGNFLAQLLGTVQNGNGKIITDPTLIVQEGQTATVQLTQDVVTELTQTIEVTETGTLTTLEIETEPAGLILQIDVDRIDDNGFVSLSVAPSISAPTDSFTSDAGTFFLLSERQISSGQVRIRDGQTLLLSGIIQESERNSVNKIPILGDIPILGALFRSTVTDNQRRELIVLLTPQILDDSDQSTFGYQYTPSESVQEILENRGRQEE
ncbi:AMIN domain-containing protein [Phormidium tenue FACHB-1052]|uniref:Type II secretory pathway, component HofQ n=2 Tax=Phormidium tenue TaxID=126344 RepID=A0A1U7JAF0_9CYAN|nr:AMIN domain-containing protein [Phormidium tenue]MBD2230466.1 AMIN domain-containing protein [Phormidium tenue FACHB-1052]OKH50747.1 type II secretory pathway, component HofQ [Phormidium tenue NIES-30]